MSGDFNRAGGFIRSEANGHISRENIVLKAINDSSTKYLAGLVLGQINVGSTAAFAQSGAGCTCGTITLGANVKAGVYSGECIKAGATGMFALSDPNGIFVGTVIVGTAFSGGGLGFTLSDAGAHVAVGDTFTITVGTAAFANAGGDTGNGTCSAITVVPGVIGGVYTFTAIDATHFTGVDPVGRALPNLLVGSEYDAGGLKFTITAGGSAYVAGDKFTITTATGSQKYVAVSASAIDGSENAAALLIFPADVSGATDVPAAVIVRHCEVEDALIVWPSGATDDQILNWKAQLSAKGIIFRSAQV